MIIVFKEITRTLNKIKKKKSLSVYCIKLLDKHKIICGDGVGGLEIWDIEKGDRIQTLPCAHDKHIWHLDLISSGQLVTSSGDSTIRVWSIQEGLINKDFKMLDTKGHLHEFLSFIVRKDGFLISGSWIGFKSHDLNTEKCTDIKETKAVNQLSFCGK